MKKPSTVLIVSALFLILIGSGVYAQITSQEFPGDIRLPGTTEGTGTHFEITDSVFLNITLDSSEEIYLILQSAPEIVTMYIRPVSEAPSTVITISGFEPNYIYYKYEDNYHNLVEFTTDETGSYIYTQDLSEEHFVFFQLTASTLFIKDDFTGGNCILIGNWDSDSKTCTMTTDLDDPIEKTVQIDDDLITFDGDEHTINSNLGSAGINSSETTEITIRNVKVEGAYAGISLFKCSDSSVTGNIVSNGYLGIQLMASENNTVTGNAVISNGVGVYNVNSNNSLIKNNTLSGNSYGIYLITSNGNIIVNNNFLNNTVQAISYSSSNVFDLAAPIGGNYWSNWTSPDEDEDGFVDYPFVFYGGQDNLPYTTIMVWPQGLDTTPPEIVISTPLPYGVYDLVTGVTLNFTASDSESGLKYVKGELSKVGEEAVEVSSGFAVTEPGVYTLEVTAEDNADNLATSSVSFVVYDTMGGFVTGGGWFHPDSESNLPSEGKANFGFVSRYKEDGAIGNLEFQYQYRRINLKSTEIEWMVISGTHTQFQGTSTINGEGTYTFRVIAEDNETPGKDNDFFEIRIWEGSEATGEMLYRAKNALRGGNIAIHKN